MTIARRAPAGVPIFGQWTPTDCGIACLRIILKHHGVSCSHAQLCEGVKFGARGLSLLAICKIAERFGFAAHGRETTYDGLVQNTPLPCIAHWNGNHFVVVLQAEPDTVHLADPARGLVTVTKRAFRKAWIANKVEGNEYGVVAILHPTDNPRMIAR